MLGLGILAVLLVRVHGYGVDRAGLCSQAASWPVLLVAYVVLGFCWYGNHSIVNFNLNSQPAHSELMGATSPATSNSDTRTFSQLRL